MKEDNLSIKKDGQKEEIIETNEELKGNKFLIFLCNLMDPINSPLSFGPKLIKFNWIINAQKTGTIIVMSLLMFYYKNYSKGAWLYLSLHGTYGLLWFLKDMVFPDKSFQHKLTILPSILVSIFLLSYWLMGFEVMSGIGDQTPSGKKIFGCFFLFSLGNINRNTNYFGEILVYLTFAIACGRKEGYIMLIVEWIIFFGSRIYMKDLRLARKHGFEKYKQNSYIILFKFFDSHLANFILYLLIIICIYVFIYIL